MDEIPARRLLQLTDSGRHQPVLSSPDGAVKITVALRPRNGYLVGTSRAYMDMDTGMRCSFRWQRMTRNSALAMLASCLRDGYVEEEE